MPTTMFVWISYSKLQCSYINGALFVCTCTYIQHNAIYSYIIMSSVNTNTAAGVMGRRYVNEYNSDCLFGKELGDWCECDLCVVISE